MNWREAGRLDPFVIIFLLLTLFARQAPGSCRDKKSCKVAFPQQELRKRLTAQQYHVTQEKGTESPFTGEYTLYKDKGTYNCVVCGTPLFTMLTVAGIQCYGLKTTITSTWSETKFDSGSGWPSFYDLLDSNAITLVDDFSHGMHRIEASCSYCGAHLGHVFDDGPRPTGKRYCINSASLSFIPTGQSSTDEGNDPTPSGKTEL